MGLGGGKIRDGDSSVGRTSDCKARRSTDAGSSPRCGKRFTSQSQLPEQTYGVHTTPVCNRVP